jgi:tetratricopeptide (TPR) repeat protein
MGHQYAASQQVRSTRVVGYVLAGFALFATLLALPLHSQESATLSGTVRDEHGAPVVDAIIHLQTVQLQIKDAVQTQSCHTDAQGIFTFGALRGGVYALRAEKPGYSEAEVPSIFLGPNETKRVDLDLLARRATASSSSPRPQFFDQPQFTVSGVTDTTSLGGHGSDTIVRTRDTLAKETVSLGKGSSGNARAETPESEKSLRERAEREPNSFESNHRLGKALAENGKAREAIPYLERAAELKPGDYDNTYILALANARAGNYERARDDAQSLLSRALTERDDNDKAEVHHLLGDVQEKLGNSLEAVREYQRAADLEPSEAYLFDWGSELLLHHAPEPAQQVFTTGNRLFPRSVRMLIGLGASWFARGSYDQAVQRICEASDLDPNGPVPYQFLGKVQSTENTPSEKTVETLRRFVEQQPGNAEANYYYAVGLWKLQKGRPNEAGAAQVESLLKKAVQLDPLFSAAYLQMGILHSARHDYLLAVSDYQQAVQADPQMEEAHYRLAQAYRQIGQTASAEAELKAYAQITQESSRKADRERHEIRQFVYTLRDQRPGEAP